MWPDRVSNPGPLTYESGALPIALHGPASRTVAALCKTEENMAVYHLKLLEKNCLKKL